MYLGSRVPRQFFLAGEFYLPPECSGLFIAQRHQGDLTGAVVPSPDKRPVVPRVHRGLYWPIRAQYLHHMIHTLCGHHPRLMSQEINNILNDWNIRYIFIWFIHCDNAGMAEEPHLIFRSIGVTCWGTPPPSSQGTPCSSWTGGSQRPKTTSIESQSHLVPWFMCHTWYLAQLEQLAGVPHHPPLGVHLVAH